MTFFRAFFDDSWDGTQEKYAIAGGVIAKNSDWINFNAAWRRVLRQEPYTPWFHTKEWKRLNGAFRGYRKLPKPDGRSSADEKRERLKGVIESSPVVAMAIAVLIEDYEQVRKAHPRAALKFHEDPYTGALQSFVYEAVNDMHKVDPRSVVSFVSDKSDRAAFYTKVYADFKKSNPKTARYMAGLTHLDDNNCPGLQAADMVAHIINREYRQWLETGRQPWDSIAELQSRIFRVAHWDKNYMCHIMKDTEQIDLFDQLGVDPSPRKTDEELEREREQRAQINNAKAK